MAYRLAIWRGAQRDLKRFGPQERARIVNAMKSLEDEPLTRPDVTSMKALAGFFRLRVGDYRIIFTVEGRNTLDMAYCFRIFPFRRQPCYMGNYRGR